MGEDLGIELGETLGIELGENFGVDKVVRVDKVNMKNIQVFRNILKF